MKVAYRNTVEQVRDGYEYRVRLVVGRVLFECNVKFVVHIERLGDLLPARDQNDAQRLFELVVQKYETPIPLTDREWQFFVEPTMEQVTRFYYTPSIRVANGTVLAPLVEANGGKTGIEITEEGFVDLSDDTITMLRQPKFGCRF